MGRRRPLVGQAQVHAPAQASLAAQASHAAPPQQQQGGQTTQAAQALQAAPPQQKQGGQAADIWYDPTYPDKAPPTHEARVHLGRGWSKHDWTQMGV